MSDNALDTDPFEAALGHEVMIDTAYPINPLRSSVAPWENTRIAKLAHAHREIATPCGRWRNWCRMEI